MRFMRAFVRNVALLLGRLSSRRSAAAGGFLALMVAALASAQAAAQVNPFARPKAVGYLPGAVYLSDGRIIVGGVRLTTDKSLHVFAPSRKRGLQIPLDTLNEIKVKVKKVRVEKEWRFKHSGSPEKVYTGKTYARLDYSFEFVFGNGETLAADLLLGTPVYVLPDGSPPEEQKKETPGTEPAPPRKPRPMRLLLQPHQVGKVGTAAEDVLHIKRIVLGEKAKAEATAEIERRRKLKLEKRTPADPEKPAAKSSADASPEKGKAETPKPD